MWYLISLIVLESTSYILIQYFKKEFQWLITPADRQPVFDRNALKKFIKHGYDPHLGWVRKPHTEKIETNKFTKTTYHIDATGARENPGHERLSKDILCFGDSFTFGRQVNDNETFEWFLSEKTKTNVTNFGVGNYGLDQALLRLARECPRYSPKVVIIGVVPSTIVRILSVWKHYNEFGNIFGFKPRFLLKEGRLQLFENIMDEEKKFLQYTKHLPRIKQHDPFHQEKFEKEIIRFPYLVSILNNPFRNIPILAITALSKLFPSYHEDHSYPPAMKIIMKSNLDLRKNLFKKDKGACELLEKLIEQFIQYGQDYNFTPLFLWMPQKDDILDIKEKKSNYYSNFISKIRKKTITIDLTERLLASNNLNLLYSDNTRYGGHFSSKGNELIATILFKTLTQHQLLTK